MPDIVWFILGNCVANYDNVLASQNIASVYRVHYNYGLNGKLDQRSKEKG